MIKGWKPGDDVCIVFDDKTTARRTESELKTLVDELTEVANRHDFDLSQFGTNSSFAKFFHHYYNADGSHRQ